MRKNTYETGCFPMNIELRQLYILVEVVRAQSFSLASYKLFLSQSTISTHIKNLETAVGAKLLNRKKVKITPTPEGEVVLKYADFILSLVDEMSEYITQFQCGALGLLSIECASTVYPFILQNIIHDFAKKFPAIQLRITTNMTPKIIEDVMLKKVQAGMIKMPTPHCNVKGLSSILLEEDYTEIIAAANYPLLAKKNITMADISAHPILFYGYETNYYNQLKAVFEKKGLPFDVSMKFDNLEAVLTMVELGNGICFLPSKVFQERLAKAKIVTIPVQDMPLVERYTFLIFRADPEEITLPLGCFIQYIDDYGKSLDATQRLSANYNIGHATQP